MFYWLFVIILAYLFFGLASFGDKLVLAGRPQPNSYMFYVGVFGLLVAVILLPFIPIELPDNGWLMLIALDALVRILGLYSMYVGLENFEVSRVIPTIGAVQPIFILALTWVFWGSRAMTFVDALALLLLFIASIIISFEKRPKLTGRFLRIAFFSALMFSLDYILLKFIFLERPFLQGVFWVQLFVFVGVLVFLLPRKSREGIFSRHLVSDKKNQVMFVCTQVTGGIANLLQSFAISLTPVVFLATINALRGIQYAFLFIITLLASSFFPRILKEGMSKRAIFQKTFSIILIAVGLFLLII